MSDARRDGKQALFSSARPRLGTLVVECERCHARTRLAYAERVRRSLPVALWMPWRKYSRRARCPVCEQRTWLAARWFD